MNPMWIASAGVALGIIGGLVGSSIGIARAATAGLSVLAEDSGQFKWVLLLSSLPMTQTFYGFIFTLLGFSGVLPGLTGITMGKAVGIFGIGVSVMLAEFFSAIYQGSVCMSGIVELPKTKGRIATSTMILASYIELFGILGMVLGYLLLGGKASPHTRLWG
ncbi:MAG: ATPase [Desulfurococcales archaeon]|nr:ATPase [Desulfurococcales archaeon]